MSLQQPQFLTQNELDDYGLPDPTEEKSIVAYIQRASSLIDMHCGRQDTDGRGSLVYTTYTERIYLPESRNIFRLSFRPLTAVSTLVFNSYAASATNLTAANTQTASDGVTLSPIVSLKGRYGYGRRAQQQVYPDLNYGANILQIASYFGGPPQFVDIDVSHTDFDPRTAELWVPAGLYMAAYTEVFAEYNSGFPPDNLPHPIKQATAMVIINFLQRPSTGLRGFGVGRVHHEFTEELIDVSIQNILKPYRTVLAF